jgi:hypothetical protein
MYCRALGTFTIVKSKFGRYSVNGYDFTIGSIHLPIHIYLITIVSGTKTCNIEISRGTQLPAEKMNNKKGEYYVVDNSCNTDNFMGARVGVWLYAR